MEEKTTNQNNQNNPNGQGSQNSNQSSSQNNSNNTQNTKPTLSWTQPVQSSSNKAMSGNHAGGSSQPNSHTNSASASAAASTQSGFRTAALVLGIFIVCVLALWGMVALRDKSQSVVSITSSSTDTDIAGTDATDATSTMTAANTNSTDTSVTTVSQAPTQPTSASSAPAGTGISTSGPLPINVASPQVAGDSVAISGVSVSSPTWFVVYQNNSGAMGNALGAGLFLPGGVTSGTISLLRATVAGQSYFVGESVDDGDKVFTLHGDPQTKDASGNVLLKTFQAN